MLFAGCSWFHKTEEFCVSGGSHEANNTCNEVLKLQTTHVRTKQEIIDQIDRFEEVYRSHGTDVGIDMGVGIDIPIDGIPIPFDFSGAGDFSKDDIEKTLSHYQQLYNFNFDEERDISFLDPSQVTAWLSCQNDNRQGPKMQSEYKIEGDKIFFSVVLESNFKSSKVRECVYTNGGDIIRYEDPATHKDLDVLHAGEARSFSFSIDTLKPFIFRLVTDCFEPVTLYVPAKPKLAEQTAYVSERSLIVLGPGPDVRPAITDNSQTKFTLKVVNQLGEPLRGQIVYASFFLADAKIRPYPHFDAKKYYTDKDGDIAPVLVYPNTPGDPNSVITILFALSPDMKEDVKELEYMLINN